MVKSSFAVVYPSGLRSLGILDVYAVGEGDCSSGILEVEVWEDLGSAREVAVMGVGDMGTVGVQRVEKEVFLDFSLGDFSNKDVF